MSRLERLVGQLREFYGLLPTPPSDPFQLFVWEILSHQSTPQQRNSAITSLKRNLALTPDSMSKVAPKKLEESVKLAGPYGEQRLHALRTGVDIFRRTPKLPSIIRGPITSARRALKGLPQMGEGGAYRMLLFAADQPVLPVDARVSRVARRLGYGDTQGDFAKTARSVRDAVSNELPPDIEAYQRAFLYLSHHGAATCTEGDPHCTVCPLLPDCPEGHRRVARQG